MSLTTASGSDVPVMPAMRILQIFNKPLKRS